MGLLGGVKGRNHHAGHHTPVVKHMGQIPSRCILWSSPRASWVPGFRVEEGNLFNVEKKRSRRGLGKTPWLLPPQELPHQKDPPYQKVPSQTPRAKVFICSTSPDPSSIPEPEGVMPPQDLALVPRRWPPPLQVLSPGPGWPHHATPRGCTPVWNNDLVGPLHTRVTRDDYLPHSSNGWGPLLCSGSDPYQDIPTKHLLPETPGTLPKGWRTLSNYNYQLHHGNSCPKYWPKWMSALPMKWILELSEYLLLMKENHLSQLTNLKITEIEKNSN